jgi:CDP-diacylglycerol pyrophosphatase
MIQIPGTKTFLFVVFCFSVLVQIPAHAGNPNFLWEVVSLDCVPNQKVHQNPDPCVEVTFDKGGEKGYAVFKDYNGPLHYLLLPTTQITGIESPEILTQDSPNYFYRAWESRSYMEKLLGAPIAPEEISLAVNSQFGRSQLQLHVHISCTRTDVKEILKQNLALIGLNWAPFSPAIMGHTYFARRITLHQLKEQNAFKLLANDLPGAASTMNQFGLAVVAIKNAAGELEFVMLADRAVEAQSKGHVEEIQDHQCTQLYP